MEFSIVSTELTSKEIKPAKGLSEYFNLIEDEVKKCFSSSKLMISNCPACQSQSVKTDFSKFGVKYSTCEDCLTVYAANRIKQDELNKFYIQSKARKYWFENIWKPSKNSRIEKIITPLNDWVLNFLTPRFYDQKLNLAEYLPNNLTFFQNWTRDDWNLALVEPTCPDIASKVTSENIITKSDAGKFKAFLLFDTLDRVENPKDVIDWIYDHLEEDGLCFITGVLATGLDNLLLGKESKTILPPDRLNCFSFEGIQQLFEKFEILEMSTPGLLDLENIKNSNDLEKFPFLNYIFNYRKDDFLVHKFQQFLQENRLSSRMRIVLQRK